MGFLGYFSRRTSPPVKSARRGAFASGRRPRFEPLEQRTMLSVVSLSAVEDGSPDTFDVSRVGDMLEVTINGTTQTYDVVETTELVLNGSGDDDTLTVNSLGDFTGAVVFNAGGGTNIVHIYDTDGDDLFEASPTHCEMVMEGAYHVEANDVEEMYGYASSGMDTATLQDAAATADRFRGYANESRLYSDDFYIRAKGFDQVTATATSGQDDIALFYDGAGSDIFEASPTTAKLKYDGSEDHSAQANGFRYVHAIATAGGDDTASLQDAAATADRFKGYADESKLYSDDFYIRAKGFDQVTATATSGQGDIALFYDGAGSDIFEASPTTAKLKYDGSEDHSAQANGFRYVHAIATAGGNDTASLQDAAATADRFRGYANESRLYSDDFYIRAKGFDQVTATATPGQGDIALFYDGAGSDIFEASPTTAKLKYDGSEDHSAQANGFRYVHAIATAGGNDTASLQDSAATADRFKSYANESKLYNDDFYIRAKGFDRVTATATPGQGDIAQLYDGAGSDIFEASPTTAKMKYDGSEDHFAQADGFRYVHSLAYATDMPGAIDLAYLTDSATTADRFKGYSGECKLYNDDDFYIRAKGFNRVIARATPGQDDIAQLYDGAGSDSFVATPTAATMAYDGSGDHYAKAMGFRYAHGLAYATDTPGAVDWASLYDSAATADRFKGYSGECKLYNDDDFYIRAKGFDKVTAMATPGQDDIAQLYDGDGSDSFMAGPTVATMTYDGNTDHFARASNFRYVHGLAYATDTPGAIDTATLQDSVGDDILKSYPTETELYNDTVGFYSRAKLFDEVHASGRGPDQDDFAYLYDSAGDDELAYGGYAARVSSTDLVTYLNEVEGFKHIRPRNGAGGTDSKMANPMDAGYDMDDSGWI